MKILRGLKSLRYIKHGSVITIGVFDGLHVGHKKIIQQVVQEAKSRDLNSIVITFDPHPAEIIGSQNRALSLISLDHRIKLIEELGVDILVVISFTRAISGLDPEEFVKNILIDKLNAKAIYIGDNFYFGKSAKAGIKELKIFGKRFGFKVGVIKAVKMARKIVSSSIIRKLIVSGDIDIASKFLGRRVSVLGTVVRGAQLARRLGYPTANLNPHHEIIPPSGVYAVKVRYHKRLFNGILNIGLRPTFYAPRDQEPAIEVHIFNFKGKIYNKDIEVFFIKKIRNEIKFNSNQELIEQIKKDEGKAKKILTNI